MALTAENRDLKFASVSMFSSRCVLAVRQVHVADHVHDPPVGLLGKALVKASVPGFHMENRDMKALRGDHGEAGIGIAQNQHGIRLDLIHKIIGL